jgi:hypothetical protein
MRPSRRRFEEPSGTKARSVHLFDLDGFDVTAEAEEVFGEFERELLVVTYKERSQTAVRLTLTNRP